MFIQDMIFHRSTPMLLVVTNPIFLPFDGIIGTIILANRMANHTMYSLKYNKILFIAIIHHKKC